MTVCVNGKNETLQPDATLAALVAAHDLNPRHVAVEVNEQLVPRRLYETAVLHDGDRIEIVTLVGGG
jgi:sulfur carrier protein